MTTNSNYCTCGQELMEGWAMCPKCGTKIIRNDAPAEANINIEKAPLITKIKEDVVHERSVFIQSKGYQIINNLPSGGMADLVHVKKEGKEYVFKFLKKGYEKDPEYIKRFIAEARRTHDLKHPNIIKVYDYEKEKDAPIHFYIMEYMQDGTLEAQLRKKGKLSVEEANKIIIQLANALVFAHEQAPSPIVHRDIKPSNILFMGDHVVLTDFGIAKTVGGQTQLTTFGQIVGSSGYMSPEQLRGQIDKIDHRTDIYSLGVVFYSLLTGKEPFSGPNDASITTQHLMKPVVPPTVLEPNISPFISGVIIQMLGKEIENRLPNMRSVITLLKQEPNEEVLDYYEKLHFMALQAYEMHSGETDKKTLIKPAKLLNYHFDKDDLFMKMCNMWIQYSAGYGMPKEIKYAQFRFPKQFGLGDCQLKVCLDERPIYYGSFKSGFDFNVKISSGSHIVEYKVIIGRIASKLFKLAGEDNLSQKFSFEIDDNLFVDRNTINLDFDYNRFSGKLGIKMMGISVKRITDAPTFWSEFKKHLK